MIHRHSLDELQNGVKSLLAKGGYAFSEEDKALLEAILIELEETSKDKTNDKEVDILKILSLLLQFLKFFGIDDVTKLF